MSTPPTGLSYDDVLLVPQRSPVDSRRDVDLGTNLTGDIELDVPVLSSPMDTVTEAELAVALSRAGGFGTIHRFSTVEEQANEVREVTAAGQPVGAALGIDEDVLDRAEAVVAAGADCLMVDVAHGHLEKCLDAVGRVREAFPETPLVAGNVVTTDGVADLHAAGADCVKVGVGPGSHCTTREVAGVGVPQFTAVRECARAAREHGIRIIADGGVRSSGDAVKALLAGADTVMMGSFFAGTDESPAELVEHDGRTYARSRGLASEAAGEARTDKLEDVTAEEGVEGLSPYRGPVAEAVAEFAAGIRSGLSYCGGHDVRAARENAEFVRVTGGAKEREGTHSIVELE